MKALEILTILKQENFRFERLGNNKKDFCIDNKTLSIAIKELKSLKNKSCDNCKFEMIGHAYCLKLVKRPLCYSIKKFNCSFWEQQC